MLRENPIRVIVGHVSGIAIADGEIELAIGTELRASGRRTGTPGVGLEDLLDVRERLAVEARARRRDRRLRAARLHVRQIHEPVLRELRVQHDEFKLRVAIDASGHPAIGCRIEHSLADDAQGAGQLGHEHVGAARQKRQVPRPNETGYDGRHADANELARIAAAVRCARRRAGSRCVRIEEPKARRERNRRRRFVRPPRWRRAEPRDEEERSLSRHGFPLHAR